MEQKKLEYLENIRKYIEEDDIKGLTAYVEKIKSKVKKDLDFQDIFNELKNKNYDQALFLTEEYIYDLKDMEFEEDYGEVGINEIEEKDDLYFEENPEDDQFGDFTDDQFSDMNYYGDKDDDYY
jgi:hypothetical protein